MKRQRIILVIFLIVHGLVSSQNDNKSFIYAGRFVYRGFDIIMQDYAYLFREDGSFCDTLDEKDWQTKVSGYYKQPNKNTIILNYLDQEDESDTISIKRHKDGEKAYLGSIPVFKLKPTDYIPLGFYMLETSYSSGGMGTGTAYVGHFENEGYLFKSDYTFQVNGESTTMLIGSAVGGSENSREIGKGTYVLKDGLLQLRFDDGRSEEHNFFCDLTARENSIAIIDGSVYYYKKIKE